MLRQTNNLEATSIRHRNDIEKFTCGTHRYFIDFESRIDMELSTPNRCHLFHVDLPFIIDEILTNFRRGISMSNRWRIGDDVSIGIVILDTASKMNQRHKKQK